MFFGSTRLGYGSPVLGYLFLILQLCTVTVRCCFRLKELRIKVNSKYGATKLAAESLIA
jgi:hypothetical protein